MSLRKVDGKVHKKPTIIVAIASFLLSAMIGLMAIQSNKINVCPEGDFKRLNEMC